MRATIDDDLNFPRAAHCTVIALQGVHRTSLEEFLVLVHDPLSSKSLMPISSGLPAGGPLEIF